MSMIDDRITWLATGGTTNLTVDLLAPLGNKNVILFPDAPAKEKDVTAFNKWNGIATKARDLGYKVTCSTTLEKLYGHLNNGYDLADHYLIGNRITDKNPVKPKEEVFDNNEVLKPTVILSPEENICYRMNQKNKALGLLVKEFDLVMKDGQKPRLISA